MRVLVIPGLHDSGDAHWQTWLQTQYQDTARVVQPHWDQPDLDTWSAQIGHAIEQAGPDTVWVAAAHSFGCLALAHHLGKHQRQGTGVRQRIAAALLVAPADPVKFDVAHRLPEFDLGIESTVIGSENDPWMPLHRAQAWADHWGARFLNLGEVGHINTESGFGPWPLARYKVDQMIRNQLADRPRAAWGISPVA